MRGETLRHRSPPTTKGKASGLCFATQRAAQAKESSAPPGEHGPPPRLPLFAVFSRSCRSIGAICSELNVLQPIPRGRFRAHVSHERQRDASRYAGKTGAAEQRRELRAVFKTRRRSAFALRVREKPSGAGLAFGGPSRGASDGGATTTAGGHETESQQAGQRSHRGGFGDRRGVKHEAVDQKIFGTRGLSEQLEYVHPTVHP